MKLVLCNMSNALDWQQGIVNRNFFIARELINSGNFDEVVLVDFLSLNPMGPLFGRRRTAKYAFQIVRKREKGNTSHRYGLRHRLLTWTLPGQTSSTKVRLFAGLGLAHTYDRDIQTLKQALIDEGCTAENTILWSYNAFAPDLFDIPARLHVFDAVDDWSQHASYVKQRELLKSNYQSIGKRADLIFTVSEGLRSLFPLEKTAWIPNGVDLGSFANRTKQTQPAELAKLTKPIIGYVGTVQERLDFELLESVCAAIPEAQFVFVGPVWGGVQHRVDALMRVCPNVLFLGRRAYEDVPMYLAAMDVAIIPHRIDSFIQSTNPMKMYDYLAAGKPIVTTPGAGTEAFAEVISIVDNPVAFAQSIREALKDTDPKNVARRKKAVESHTWAHRVQEMRQALKRAMVRL